MDNAKNLYELNEKFSNYDFDYDLDKNSAILKEIQIFTKINKNSKVILITDDILFPLIPPFTYIGGVSFKICEVCVNSYHIHVLFDHNGYSFIGNFKKERDTVYIYNNVEKKEFNKINYKSFIKVTYIRMRE